MNQDLLKEANKKARRMNRNSVPFGELSITLVLAVGFYLLVKGVFL